jgi:radical SAM protein with 4Fe4S-binding SPASM domain
MKFYTNNSYAQMQACSGGQITPEYPHKLYLDLTQDCNLACKMCRDKVQITGKTMPFNLFCRLVDETAPYVRSYSLFNWGEPLILKDFREYVRYACSKKRADCTVDISTNGMLLTDNMINFLREMEVSVVVSFDGADKNTFESIRRGANFELVCERLKALSEAYSNMPLLKSPEIYTSVQKDNQNQLSAIAELAYSLGIKRMGYGLVTAPTEYAAEANDDLRREIEKTAEFIDSHGMLNSLYPTKVGDYLWWGNKYLHKDNFLVDTSCNAPFVSASVAYNGDVYLCCNGGDVTGNVCDKSFKEVWESAKYNELREAVNSNSDMPKRCRTCAWFNR